MLKADRLQMAPTYDEFPFSDLAWSDPEKRNEWFHLLDQDLKRDLRTWSALWIEYYDPVNGFEPAAIEIPMAAWFRGLSARVSKSIPDHIDLVIDSDWSTVDISKYC